ncbi:MAG: PRC and DUF2382 domain-containing protein [Actinomycetota bacterium]|nr:PRC and DUF2382 domain-containing protein [Actinomycetota bacterium]
MDREERNGGLRELEETYAGYEVRDPQGEKIGKVDELFVDENDRPEYIGVKMGFLGISGTTLIPAEITTVDDAHELIEVLAEKDKVKEAPGFDDDQEITPEFEREIHEYYGLEPAEGIEREPYEPYSGAEQGVAAERDEDDLEDRDELRVQRTEEELRAGTREREAGSVKVRKRVRTDRERLEVPTRREEVSVERVPVESEEASEVEIGEDEMIVPVVEEEVVVEKRPVVKEEVRLRKDVVEDEEVVEEDVRKEEIDIDDETEHRRDA